MSNRSSTKIVTDNNKKIWAHCRNCDNDTSHSILSKIEYADSSPDNDFRIWEDYCVIQCNGCLSISFYCDSRNSEDDYYDEDEQCRIPSPHIEIYPKCKKGIKELDDSYLMPIGLRSIYNETLKAIYNDLPILTGIGIRAIIEAVAKDHNIVVWGIENKIKKLFEQNIITKEAQDVLLEVKEIGNSAAHDMKIYKIRDLIAAFFVVENLIKNLYIIPELADRFKYINKKPKK